MNSGMSSSTSSPPRWRLLLGSRRMVLVLLLFGAVALLVGFLLELQFGVGIARAFVFHAAWFRGYQGLLVVVLGLSIRNRFPLQREQYGLVAAYLGLVLLLGGLGWSRTAGFQGVLFLRPGEKQKKIQVEGLGVVLGPSRRQDGFDELRFSLEPRLHAPPWILRVEDSVGPGLALEKLLLHGVLSPGIEDGGQEDPAAVLLQLTLADGHTKPITLWTGEEVSSTDLTPLRLSFASFQGGLSEAFAASPQLGSAVLKWRLQGETKWRAMAVSSASDHPSLPLGNGFQVQVLEMNQQTLKLKLSKTGEEGKVSILNLKAHDTQLAATNASFPQQAPAALAGLDDILFFPDLRTEIPSLRFFVNAGGALCVQKTNLEGRHAAEPVEVGETLSCSSTSVNLRVLDFRGHAHRIFSMHEARNGEPSTVVAHLSVHRMGHVESVWLKKGQHATLRLPEGERVLALLPNSKSLDFSVMYLTDENFPSPSREALKDSSIPIRIFPSDFRHPSLCVQLSPGLPFDYNGYRLWMDERVKGRRNSAAPVLLHLAYTPGQSLIYSAYVLFLFSFIWTLIQHRRRQQLDFSPGNQVLLVERVLKPCVTKSTTETPHPR